MAKDDLKIIILDENEFGTTLGMYDAWHNVVYFNSKIGTRAGIKNINASDEIKEKITFKETEYHEMYHKKQAYENRDLLKSCNNNSEYVTELAIRNEPFVEKLKKDEYNINGLGPKAVKYLDVGRYDEVVAYYMVKEKS